MVIVMTLPSLNRIGILVDFKVNQDFITEVLCINKDTPIAMCYGKCYLSKRLKKADEQEQNQSPKNVKDKIEIVLFLHHASTNVLNVNLPDEKITLSKYKTDFHDSSFIASIFRPPKR